jgi:hypothetical protein
MPPLGILPLLPPPPTNPRAAANESKSLTFDKAFIIKYYNGYAVILLDRDR